MLSVGIKVPHYYYVMFLPLIYFFTGPETVAPRQFLNFFTISYFHFYSFNFSYSSCVVFSQYYVTYFHNSLSEVFTSGVYKL